MTYHEDKTTKVGKIVKKDLNKTTKVNISDKRKPRIQTFVNNSRQSRNSLISEESQLFHKTKEVSQLKK